MPAKSKSSKKFTKKYQIDCSKPVGDEIFDVAEFEQFLVSHIKVDNKTGNLGNSVTVTRDADKLIVDINSTQLPKRYIKYLTKKYLKRHDLAELLRPVATAKDTYMLRYYYYENEEDKEEEE